MRMRGFTLIELITVLILVGILAITALPRFLDRNVFESRGFYDETKSLLRYAQKTAVAQRRTVCVTLGATGVGLTIAAAANSNVCDTPLALPNPPRTGVGLSSSVAALQFHSLGGTDQASNVTITVAGTAGTMTIDHTTGHVH